MTISTESLSGEFLVDMTHTITSTAGSFSATTINQLNIIPTDPDDGMRLTPSTPIIVTPGNSLFPNVPTTGLTGEVILTGQELTDFKNALQNEGDFGSVFALTGDNIAQIFTG